MVDPIAINACFASYYNTLCSSRETYSGEELDSLLNQIAFPTLDPSAHKHLDSPITLEEVKQALRALQSGKTPGVDGLPPGLL